MFIQDWTTWEIVEYLKDRQENIEVVQRNASYTVMVTLFQEHTISLEGVLLYNAENKSDLPPQAAYRQHQVKVLSIFIL